MVEMVVLLGVELSGEGELVWDDGVVCGRVSGC